MWLNILTKILPFLPALIEKLWPESAKVEQLKAERELAEAEAFEKGRISPRYFARYAFTCVLVLFALAILVDAVFPGLLPGSPVAGLETVVKQASTFLSALFGL